MPPVLEDPVLFCDIEEPRRFTQREWDVRRTEFPDNLRKDIKTNTAWEREKCDDANADDANAVG